MTILSETNKAQKKVSVIIPTFNRAEFLNRAVKSIIDQEYKNLEILIVDDRSNDDTEAVVKDLIGRYPHIKYCVNRRSKGPSGARNTGIIESSGEYLAFLDSDDVWLPKHLSEGVRFLDQHPEIDVLFGNFKVVRLDSGEHLFDFFDQHDSLFSLEFERISDHVRIIHGNLFKLLVQDSFFHFGSSIVRKSLTKGVLLDESISFAEDRDYAIRLFKEANATFAYREDPVFILHRHDSSLTGDDGLDRTQCVVETHLYLLDKYSKEYAVTKDEEDVISSMIVKRLINLSYIHRMKNESWKSMSSTLGSLRYSLSFGQFKELFKVLASFTNLH
jgi:glycosyltransferase involved in cell wall biosynthesis